ncbi:hypothetical protein NL443_00620 [Bacillus nakamurai]|nr:hypothetical protein [Bacillus nakamurai]MCP6680671.1 hypothetical protein [Bacillus nakamurai]
MLWVALQQEQILERPWNSAAPKGSQSQAVFGVLMIVSGTNMICYSYDHEIGGHPISFFMGLFIIVKNLTTEAFSDNPCADAFTSSVDACTCTSRTIRK